MTLAAITDLQAANFADHGKWRGRKGYFISRTTAVFIALFCVCSHVVIGLLVFYCVPRCSSSQLHAADMNLGPPGTGNQVTLPGHKTFSSNRLPIHILPTHYRSELFQSSMEVKQSCIDIIDSIPVILNTTDE
jgi:hypothetical protein